MKTAAVICEYNPFHNGHAHFISELRKNTDEPLTVIAVMSGNFVQRGDFALAPKYERAKTAVLGGADLVLELPYPWSVAGAESFATAGVSIADKLGICDYLAFGSECGDIKKLTLLSERLSSRPFAERLAAARADRSFASYGAAVLREQLYREMWDDDMTELLRAPNNILGIEYITALRRRKSGIVPVTVLREGAGHDSDGGGGNGFASASEIRRLITENNEIPAELIPTQCVKILEKAVADGLAPAGISRLDAAFSAMLRMADPEDLASFAEVSRDLSARISAAARDATGFDDLLSLLKTKRYTDSRLRRALIFSLLGTKKSQIKSTPAYTAMLAADAEGIAAMRRIAENGRIDVLTKPADTDKLTMTGRRQARYAERADSIYALSLPKPLDAGYFVRCTPYVEI